MLNDIHTFAFNDFEIIPCSHIDKFSFHTIFVSGSISFYISFHSQVICALHYIHTFATHRSIIILRSTFKLGSEWIAAMNLIGKYGLEDNLLFLSSICISTLTSTSCSNFFGFSASRLGLDFEGSDSLSDFLNATGFSSGRLGLPAAGCGLLVGDIKEEIVYFSFTCHPLVAEDFFRAAEVGWVFQQLELVLVDRLP
ncbi:hypothetical protein ALC53_03191 [Atta colombica]|uniref:Uncharacterized protein n=1 Tax=Atta colombica TaxID=520822 RepID=A0A151I5E3_9HYME|nr:hypothetical protein ALC53_03191 [Atta colombica]